MTFEELNIGDVFTTNNIYQDAILTKIDEKSVNCSSCIGRHAAGANWVVNLVTPASSIIVKEED